MHPVWSSSVTIVTDVCCLKTSLYLCVRTSMSVESLNDASAFSSPHRPAQQPATHMPTHSQSAVSQLTSVSSSPHRDAVPTQKQTDGVSASGHQRNTSDGNRSDLQSASKRPPNVSPPGHLGGMSAGSRRTGGHAVSTVVLPQANFRPPKTLKSSSILAVATHVDEQCQIFVHEIHNGL